VPRIFHRGPRPKGQKSRLKAESGGGVLGEPPHELGSLGKAVSFPSGVLVGALTAQRFSTIFSTQDGLS